MPTLVRLVYLIRSTPLQGHCSTEFLVCRERGFQHLICWSPLRVRVLFGLVDVFPFEWNLILWVARQAAWLCSFVNGHSSDSGLTHPLNIKKAERGISLISKERLYKGLILSWQYLVIWPNKLPAETNSIFIALTEKKKKKRCWKPIHISTYFGLSYTKEGSSQ